MAAAIRLPQLISFLHKSAPKKSEQINHYFRDGGIEFVVLEDEERPLFQAIVNNNQIRVGLKAIPRLWAMCCSNVSIYEAAANLREGNPDATVLEIDEDHYAVKLLNWSVIGDINMELYLRDQGAARPDMLFNIERTLEFFPFHVIEPLAKGEPGTELHRAWLFFRMALGFLLHHELAHFRIAEQYGDALDSKEEEYLADREAANWMLDGIKEGSPEFEGGAGGMCLGLLWLATVESYLGAKEGGTHPPGYARLDAILDEFVKTPSHSAWVLAALVLHFHLDNFRGLPDGVPNPANGKEAFKMYARLIAELPPIGPAVAEETE